MSESKFDLSNFGVNINLCIRPLDRRIVARDWCFFRVLKIFKDLDNRQEFLSQGVSQN